MPPGSELAADSFTEGGLHPVSQCFHCGEPVPDNADFSVEIGGRQRSMCCPGCCAVASLINDSGMARFYERRTGYNVRPPDDAPQAADFGVYDDPQVAATFTRYTGEGLCEARLLLGGISCAACTWLIEHSLLQLCGVRTARVNLQHQRLDLAVDTGRLPLSAVFAHLAALGYQARPFLAEAQREQSESEYRVGLRRLAVAGLGMMQVGMFAIALHAGDIQGIADEYRALMRWVSLLIASFVVMFSSRTFFENAWRHLRAGMLVMDLPVALAIGLAWLASAWATLSGSGQVYFDSIVMFTFFLLLGRFLEQRARRRLQLNWYNVEDSLPAAIQCRRAGKWVSSPRIAVRQGDRILVSAGATVPVDGRVLSGHSSVREDTFNGEQRPRPVAAGDAIFAGTLNLEDRVEISASGTCSETRLAALQQSVGRANAGKPRLRRLADRVAGYFVFGVLILASATALVWSQLDPGKALWITLSVLVISCPCALALATPVALTSAAAALRHRGVLVHGETALEALARCTHMLFDKTGTLTEGRLALVRVQLLAQKSREELEAVAAALQQASRHPVAKAFDSTPPAAGFANLHYRVGAGVSGELHGQEWRMGSDNFCRELAPALPGEPREPLYWVALVRSGEPLAWFGFSDPLRADAAPLFRTLARDGIRCEILSGDSPARMGQAASLPGVAAVRGGLSPQEKLQHLADLQASGAVVAATGDGLNDGPLLAQADASFAVAEATDLARAEADFVIERGNLGAIDLTRHAARRCRHVIVQNLGWALTYNVCALPLAALGHVAPWAAAIGMSASSLLVVLNSLRLTRLPTPR